MALETATYISDLVSTNPTASDNISQGDDHIRLLKATVKASFPNVTGAMTRTHTDLNNAVTLAGSETLTNKSLTAPTITGTTILGAGNATATPVDAILAGASGSGTNIAGADIIVRAGNGTGTGGSGYIAFETAAAGSSGSTANTLTERMRIDANGNVGIGTASPGATFKLDVQNSSASIIRLKGGASSGQSSAIYFTDPSSTNTMGAFGDAAAIIGGTVNQAVNIYSNNLPITFNQASNERMRIDSSGNVGIGTASPTSYVNSGSGFAVIGTNSQTQAYFGSSTSGVTVAAYTGAVYFQSSSTNDLVLGSAGAANTIFRTNATERLRIGSSGQLGIGGANYGTSGQVLTSGGSGAAPSWATPSSGGMTLLGTLTTTSGSTQSLSSLTLTGYRALYFVYKGVSATGNFSIVIDGVQFALSVNSANTVSGYVWLDLQFGTAFGVAAANNSFSASSAVNGTTPSGYSAYYGKTSYTTATTTVTISTGGAATFDAGSVDVYGVK